MFALAADEGHGPHRETMRYLNARVLGALRDANARDASRAVAAQCLSSPSGTQYVGAITGRLLSKAQLEALRTATAQLRASSALFDGSQYVFLGDFLAEFDHGATDAATLKLLRGAAGESIVSQPFDALLLADHPLLLNHGVPALKQFFADVLEAQLNPTFTAAWSWGDVAMVAIVITTSAVWERRLARIFDEHVLPKRVVAALARYVMDAAAGAGPRAATHVPTCDFAPLLTLTALGILHAAEKIAAPADAPTA